MLVVDSELEASFCWSFNGESLYLLENGQYCLLIPAQYTENSSLSAEGFQLLRVVTGSAPVLTRNGDVNKDGTLNIADANILCQIINVGVDYYDLQELSLYQRLLADVNGDMRYTIEDLNAIIDRINGTN